ncbi:MAG: hypothetical protein FJX54_23735 [Alphaproteobacteria bacterium]|nr:hypothetical protein [Alphaproteobacteria bacterium]
MQSNSTTNGHDTYDAVTILFHWVIALMVIALFLLALFPGLVKGAIFWHKTIGILVLGLVPLRALWRLTFGRRSQAAAREPALLRLAAKASHLGVYALLVVTPMLGWLYQDAKAIEVVEFGFELPMLLYPAFPR